MQRALGSLHRRTMRVGLFVLVVVVVLAVAELTWPRFNEFTSDHSLISTFITEAVLLVGVYLVIDEIIERRDTRRWSDVMSLGIRALSTRADGPAAVVRRAVDELAVGIERPRLDGADASGDGAVNYQELVSRHADRLADRLRADDWRARSFADETRRSASMLEEAIIQWGPTLVEDSDSAELINLLPDIVDSARTAADTIATRAWTDGERELFKQSLLEILENADEFHSRVSRRARVSPATADPG